MKEQCSHNPFAVHTHVHNLEIAQIYFIEQISHFDEDMT